jgi:flavin reductase (DIM6/NTAB) family NADH-FMN oxidoreductase RutF
VPLLTDALATLACQIVAEHPAGDHRIVVGRVDDLRVPPVDGPLILFAGAFGTRRDSTGPLTWPVALTAMASRDPGGGCR